MRIGPAPLLVLSVGLTIGCEPGDGSSGVSGEPGLLESASARPVTPVLAEEPPPPFGGYPGVRHGGNYMHNYYLPPAPGTTPWFPSWSPDGAAIAVGMAGSVWEVDVETGDATELTRGGTYHSSPSYSPDGRWIVYTTDYGGERIQLEMLDTESGETRVLTDDSFVYADPVFSPDGSRIAYVSSAPNGFFNVYIRAVADGDWRDPRSPSAATTATGITGSTSGPWTCTCPPPGCLTERNSSSSRTGTSRWARGT
ncbi:TolB family protein [Candidatus Palauibacter sp.]|uniref:TolB family protein n=1 Tax=Candidatus Palauibacter sp. TaxID=3101350 RepID=UPI003B52EC82